MRRFTYILPAVLLVHFTGLAQTAQFIPRESIEHTVIGWMRPHSVTPRKPLKVDDKLYSPAQLAMADAFATWIQASYVPKGGLGEVRVIVSEKLGQYSQTDAALPQSYGAFAKTYTELKYDANRKMVPATNSHLRWSILANRVAFGEPLQVLNTATDYYFLMPLFGEPVPAKTQDDETRIRQRYDLSSHPAVKRYITYFNFQKYSSRYASSSNVLLCRDNTCPFVKITKAEYLEKLAGAVERKYAQEKEAAIKSWPEGKTRTTALASVDARYQKRSSALQNARAKYEGRLQETAEVSRLQPDVMLENNPDVFGDTAAASHTFSVYKIDPATAALAKSDRPQWILVSWDGNINTDPVAKQLHDAILNNFNFEYLYDFVFNPEKVKGQSYQPLRAPAVKEPG